MPRCVTGNHFAKKVGDKNCSACLKDVRKRKAERLTVNPKSLNPSKNTVPSTESNKTGWRSETVGRLCFSQFLPEQNDAVLEVETVSNGFSLHPQPRFRTDDLVTVNVGDKIFFRHYVFALPTAPDGILDKFNVIKVKGKEKYYWVNRGGYLHRGTGKPAFLDFSSNAMVVAWVENGRWHRLDGPAIILPGGNEEWRVRGMRSDNVELCRKAVSLETTRQEFYKLFTHNDPVVREFARSNPKFPLEFKVADRILRK